MKAEVWHSSQVSSRMIDEYERGVTSRHSSGGCKWFIVINGKEIYMAYAYESDAREKAKALNKEDA